MKQFKLAYLIISIDGKCIVNFGLVFSSLVIHFYIDSADIKVWIIVSGLTQRCGILNIECRDKNAISRNQCYIDVPAEVVHKVTWK